MLVATSAAEDGISYYFWCLQFTGCRLLEERHAFLICIFLSPPPASQKASAEASGTPGCVLLEETCTDSQRRLGKSSAAGRRPCSCCQDSLGGGGHQGWRCLIAPGEVEAAGCPPRSESPWDKLREAGGLAPHQLLDPRAACPATASLPASAPLFAKWEYGTTHKGEGQNPSRSCRGPAGLPQRMFLQPLLQRIWCIYVATDALRIKEPVQGRHPELEGCPPETTKQAEEEGKTQSLLTWNSQEHLLPASLQGTRV
ncbi:uncharacterized protein LOC132507518 [Lagenorhynchus albirostris]|uniref:uncharacterized protein LOC132507518 n=1 Tax=Lagenorhynchus albirostris TaxID=27610 RepID=UPI0028E382AB|nr:uncharacterized protein LOC132507518 [Lagenorhynchus albirostris]